MNLAGVLLALVVMSVAAAPTQYWMCLRPDGTKAAQDRPCAENQSTIAAPVSAATETKQVQPPSTAVRPSAPLRPKPIDVSKALQPLVNMVWVGAAVLVCLFVVFLIARLVMYRLLRRALKVLRDWIVPATAAKERTAPNPFGGETATGLKVVRTEWSEDLLKQLEWRRFEILCAGFWRAKGYNADLSGPGADGGVDVFVRDPANPHQIFAVIQCKAWSSAPVGVETIRALWGAKDHFKAQTAILHVTSDFTADAYGFAAAKPLQLISLAEFVRQLKALPTDLSRQLSAEVTKGDYTTPTCPSCDIKMVRRLGSGGKSDFWGCVNFRKCGGGTFPVRI